MIAAKTGDDFERNGKKYEAANGNPDGVHGLSS
jgi:hypothetical protein